MWRNADVLDFVGWLRAHNDDARRAAAVGFYGLDLYSLHASMERGARLPRRVDPEAAGARPRALRAASTTSARTRRTTATRPGSASAPSCEDEVVAQLVELQSRRAEDAPRATAASPTTS